MRAHLAPHDQFLLIAPGQRRCGDVDTGGADVVLRDDALGVALRCPHVDEGAAGVGRFGLVTEDPVLPQRRLQQQTLAVSILGDVADAGHAPPAGRPGRDVVVAQCDRARGEGTQAEQRLHQLGLAVALDASDADDLPAADGEADVVEHGPTVGRMHGQSPHVELHGVGHGGIAQLRQRQLAAHHQLGQLPGRGPAGVDGAHGRPPPHDGDLVGHREHLVELVRDEQHGQALGLELAQVAEQLVDLLRHEDRRGFVQDQDARAAVEHLGNLDALPVTDPEFLDQHVRAQAQAVGIGDLPDPAPGGPAVDDPAPDGLGPEHDVLGHGQVVGEHEMLVHHTDAGPDRVPGRAEVDGVAVDPDLALVRALHAVQDLHQRRLAGTVLTDDGMHVAAADRDVDVAVGDHPRVALGDAGQSDRGCDVGRRRREVGIADHRPFTTPTRRATGPGQTLYRASPDRFGLGPLRSSSAP